jgi:4-hydroxy-tetrahydrodipicolinate reductase
VSTKRIAIVGITGRMGGELASLAPTLGFEVTAGVAPDPGSYVATVSSAPLPLIAKTIDALDASLCDLVIDFSLPEATVAVIAWCVKNKKPLVSGVTGVSGAAKKAFELAAGDIAVLWSPNMSLGVAVMARALSALSALEGFDFQIEEFHHAQKKDRPSGTALFLQEKLKEAVGKPLPEPIAIRGGGIFGTHRVFAMGEEEMITFEHTAMNRRVFARGALKAAAWIDSRPAGLYKMDDVLGES